MEPLTQKPLVSVVLPVYNRQKYLGQAIDSVLKQTYKNWELIIADDASNDETKEFYKKYTQISQLKIYFNSQNIGLFPNLNQAIKRCKGAYILLLCSDDFLLPECLEKSLKFLQEYSSAGLILSSANIVDSNNQYLPSPAAYYYNQFAAQQLQLLMPHETLPLLLKYGSINGNLSGMFFSRDIYVRVGGFREDWKHAADWEWLYRVATSSPILISKTPVATIRHHAEQLSGINFRNLSNSLEVIEMVRILLADPYISKVDAAPRWALHIMQFHLWFAFKLALKGHFLEAFKIVKAVSQVTGFSSTLWTMLRWLPQRWRVYRQKTFALPPA
jgi:glycosyltransferase involved in cell wall biosynthesis